MLRLSVALAVAWFLVAQPTHAHSEAARLAARTRTLLTTTTTAPTRVLGAALAAPTTTTAVVASPTTVARMYPGGSVALTFDDGPDETFTPQVLDVLARYGAKATFFVVGREVERHPELARRIVAEGHVLANHTWSHADLTTVSDAEFATEVDSTQAILRATVGVTSRCVRPPFGHTNARVEELLHARGLRMANWSEGTDDWRRPGVETIVARALAGAHDGGVILFHDSGPDMSQTVSALPAIIEAMQQRGLELAPICG